MAPSSSLLCGAISLYPTQTFSASKSSASCSNDSNISRAALRAENYSEISGWIFFGSRERAVREGAGGGSLLCGTSVSQNADQAAGVPNPPWPWRSSAYAASSPSTCCTVAVLIRSSPAMRRIDLPASLACTTARRRARDVQGRPMGLPLLVPCSLARATPPAPGHGG